jgi:hypothetical protein
MMAISVIETAPDEGEFSKRIEPARPPANNAFAHPEGTEQTKSSECPGEADIYRSDQAR